MSVYFTTVPPPHCKSTLNSGGEGGTFVLARGLWVSVIFTRTGKNMPCISDQVEFVCRFACWRLTHGMAPHLTLAELDFINEKKQDGLTPVQIHARSAAQRTKKKIATPHLTNVRKAPKGKVCKRGRVETRGRRPKFTRAMVLRMDGDPASD